MCKCENCFKLAVYLLPCLRDRLCGLVRIFESGQYISRELYLGNLIRQYLQRLAILFVIGHQHFSICHILCLLPMMSPHKAL